MKKALANLPKNHRLPLLILIIEIIFLPALFFVELEKPELLNFYKRIPIIKDHKREKINPLMQSLAAKGDYAIYIKDLKKHKVYALGEQKPMPAASIYKLAVMNQVFTEIENGNLGKKEVITASKQDLDKLLEIESEEADTEAEVISLPVDYALSLMIRISDNYAALLLAEKVGWQKAQETLDKVGIVGFNLAAEQGPTVTAQAVGQLLEKIYKNEAVSQSASVEMKNLLLEQQVNDRIPRYLPEDVRVAHKTGELGNVRNDAGIVFAKKVDYIIVVLSQTDSPTTAIEDIANFSKVIYQILEK